MALHAPPNDALPRPAAGTFDFVDSFSEDLALLSTNAFYGTIWRISKFHLDASN